LGFLNPFGKGFKPPEAKNMFKLLLFIAILILIFGYRKRQKVKGGININTVLMAALVVLFIISLLTRFQN